jgi:hypothetical protein
VLLAKTNEGNAVRKGYKFAFRISLSDLNHETHNLV